MTKCDFCVYGTSCCVSSAQGCKGGGCSYAGSDECREAVRSFTEYMIAKENNKGKQKTYNKNVNIKKK